MFRGSEIVVRVERKSSRNLGRRWAPTEKGISYYGHGQRCSYNHSAVSDGRPVAATLCQDAIRRLPLSAVLL